MNGKGTTSSRSPGARASATLLLLLLGGCLGPESADDDTVEPLASRPSEEERYGARRPEPRADARRQRMATGTVTRVIEQGFFLDGVYCQVAGSSLLGDLSAGDEVMVTFRGREVVVIEKFRKNPVMRPLNAPDAPPVGAFVEIDRIKGRVLATRKNRVTLQVYEEGRAIGKTDLILRPTTILKILEDPRRKAREKPVKPPRSPDDALVAAGVPSSGPLAEVGLLVDGAPEQAANILCKVVAAGAKDGSYGVTIAVTNKSSQTLTNCELTFECATVGKVYGFTAMRLMKKGEELPPGEQRLFSMSGKPLTIGAVRSARVVLAELAFR